MQLGRRSTQKALGQGENQGERAENHTGGAPVVVSAYLPGSGRGLASKSTRVVVGKGLGGGWEAELAHLGESYW